MTTIAPVNEGKAELANVADCNLQSNVEGGKTVETVALQRKLS